MAFRSMAYNISYAYNGSRVGDSFKYEGYAAGTGFLTMLYYLYFFCEKDIIGVMPKG